jgi:hypothetical protein
MDEKEARETRRRMLREMETNVQNVILDSRRKGRPIRRKDAVRIVRLGTIERMSRVWAEESERAPLSVAEFRALLAVLNDVMDELAAKGESGEGYGR